MVVKNAFSAFTNWRNNIIYKYDQWGTTFPAWGYWWGSNKNVGLNPMTLILGGIINEGKDNIQQKTYDSMQNVFDYLLGVNPLSFSYVAANISSSDVNLQNTVKALYNYGEVAKAYFG